MSNGLREGRTKIIQECTSLQELYAIPERHTKFYFATTLDGKPCDQHHPHAASFDVVGGLSVITRNEENGFEIRRDRLLSVINKEPGRKFTSLMAWQDSCSYAQLMAAIREADV